MGADVTQASEGTQDTQADRQRDTGAEPNTPYGSTCALYSTKRVCVHSNKKSRVPPQRAHPGSYSEGTTNNNDAMYQRTVCSMDHAE